MKRRELINALCSALTDKYGEREARSMAYIVARHLYGIDRREVIVEPEREVAGYSEEKTGEALAQLLADRPVQYVVGKADFCGIEFGVAEGVLIPRPETEELVRWVLAEATGTAKILDIGTGSGAIAVSLAKHLPQGDVTAVDISAAALDIAAGNAAANGVAVRFLHADALAEDGSFDLIAGGGYDIVVSNPPYIPEREYGDMNDNVRRYEPREALFVPDGDPLLFYWEIGLKAGRVLRGGGWLYFEIHENYGEQVCALLEEQGYRNVECRDDINGKPRMVRGMKP